MNWKLCIDSAEKRVLEYCKGTLNIGPGFGAGCYADYGWSNGDGSGCGYDLGLGNGPKDAVTYHPRGVTQAQATNWWKSAKHWI